MKYTFGVKSNARLSTCDKRLQEICEKALSYGVMDITILEGHRPIHRQQELFVQGKSQIDGINKKGRHNYLPSRAVDVAPYPVDWDNEQKFTILAGLMFAAAAELGYKITWGGSWDGSFDKSKTSFLDLPHIQLEEDE